MEFKKRKIKKTVESTKTVNYIYFLCISFVKFIERLYILEVFRSSLRDLTENGICICLYECA